MLAFSVEELLEAILLHQKQRRTRKRGQAISSSSTSSRTAFTPWRTRASTSSLTSCSKFSCLFGVKCLPSHSKPTTYQTVSSSSMTQAIRDIGAAWPAELTNSVVSPTLSACCLVTVG